MNTMFPVEAHSSENLTLLPCELDKELRHKMSAYLLHNSSWNLALEIEEYIKITYKKAWSVVRRGRISERQLNKHIKNHCPSKTHLDDFVVGKPISFRYINTIANFFGVNYSINNFDPSNEFLTSIDLLEHECG